MPSHPMTEARQQVLSGKMSPLRSVVPYVGFFWVVSVTQDKPIILPDEQGKKSTQNAMEEDMEWKEKVKLERKTKNFVNIPK